MFIGFLIYQGYDQHILGKFGLYFWTGSLMRQCGLCHILKSKGKTNYFFLSSSSFVIRTSKFKTKLFLKLHLYISGTELNGMPVNLVLCLYFVVSKL